MSRALALLRDMECRDEVLALVTDAERADPEQRRALETRAHEHATRAPAQRQRETAMARAVLGFVAAQPEPEAFAARMRTGCRSLTHAYLAITLAQGDPQRACKLAQLSVGQLRALELRRPATSTERSA